MAEAVLPECCRVCHMQRPSAEYTRMSTSVGRLVLTVSWLPTIFRSPSVGDRVEWMSDGMKPCLRSRVSRPSRVTLCPLDRFSTVTVSTVVASPRAPNVMRSTFAALSANAGGGMNHAAMLRQAAT